MPYGGACSPNVSIRMTLSSFGALPCREKKLGESSRLYVVEIARVAWHSSFQPLWQEKTCNSAHEQTPLSNDTIGSVLQHRGVGWAKDLSASLVKILTDDFTSFQALAALYKWGFRSSRMLTQQVFLSDVSGPIGSIETSVTSVRSEMTQTEVVCVTGFNSLLLAAAKASIMMI